MNKIATLLFISLISLSCYSQSEIKAPFYIKVNIHEGSNDSTKIVKVKIKNNSLKTYYISNYSLNPHYLDDSICGLSLNYSNNHSDPLLMPNDTVDFFVLRPFQSISFQKEKVTKSIKTVYFDFEFIAKHKLKDKNRKLIEKRTKRKTLKLSHVEFFNDIWYADNASRIVEYVIKK